MAGLVPAIHVLFLHTVQKTWMPGTSPGMTKKDVNAMFTTFMRVGFTKAFDVIARRCGPACVWRARIGD
jgi:hypothetical protein